MTSSFGGAEQNPTDLYNEYSEESYGNIFSSEKPFPAKCIALAKLTKYRASSVFGQLRAWSEFFDLSYFASPNGLSEALGRFAVNARYFSPNYILLGMIVSCYIFLMNIAFSICLLVGVILFFFIRSEVTGHIAAGNYAGSIDICGRSFGTVQLYTFLGVYGLLAFYFTGGSSVLFWLTLCFGIVVVPHAICRRPPLSDAAYPLV